MKKTTPTIDSISVELEANETISRVCFFKMTTGKLHDFKFTSEIKDHFKQFLDFQIVNKICFFYLVTEINFNHFEIHVSFSAANKNDPTEISKLEETWNSISNKIEFQALKIDSELFKNSIFSR